MKEAGRIHYVLLRILDEVLNITLKQVIIKVPLLEGMLYLPDTAVPKPEISDDGRHLQWSVNFLPKDGMTFTHRILPMKGGQESVGGDIEISWRDNRNRPGTTTIPAARILTLGGARPEGDRP